MIFHLQNLWRLEDWGSKNRAPGIPLTTLQKLDPIFFNSENCGPFYWYIVSHWNRTSPFPNQSNLHIKFRSLAVSLRFFADQRNQHEASNFFM